MTNQGSYYITTDSPKLDKECQRLKHQAELTWKKESRNLFWFGLENGMSIVELGSGGGFITEKLLNLVPNSSITSLDISPILIEKSKKYLQNKVQDRITFVEASIVNTGMPDNTFDIAYGRLIFQHLPNPISAAKEIFRILKPGGKLIITDIDGELSWLSQPSIRDIDFILNKTADLQKKAGGNRLMGRDLLFILKESGFKNIDLETIFSHSGDLGIEGMLKQFDPFINFVRENLTDKEIELVNIWRKKLLNNSNSFIGFQYLMACGEKCV